MLAKLAAGKHDVFPLYSRCWGWSVGDVGAGLAVEIGPRHLAIAEDPDTRTAWVALTAKVRPIPGSLPRAAPVVSGMFD
jgi:hypothetical protein